MNCTRALQFLPLFFIGIGSMAMEITEQNRKSVEPSGLQQLSWATEYKSPKVERIIQRRGKDKGRSKNFISDSYKTDKFALKVALMSISTLTSVKAKADDDEIQKAVTVFEELNEKLPNVIYEHNDFIALKEVISLSKAYKKLKHKDEARRYTCLAALKSINELLELEQREQAILETQVTLFNQDEYKKFLDDSRFSAALVMPLSVACKELDYEAEARQYKCFATLKSIKELLKLERKDYTIFDALQEKVALVNKDKYKQFLDNNSFAVEIVNAIQEAEEFFKTSECKQYEYCSVFNAIKLAMEAKCEDVDVLLEKIVDLEQRDSYFFWQEGNDIDAASLGAIVDAYCHIQDIKHEYNSSKRALLQYSVAQKLNEIYTNFAEKGDDSSHKQASDIYAHYITILAKAATEYQMLFSEKKSENESLEIGATLTDISYKMSLEPKLSEECKGLAMFLRNNGIKK